MSSRSTASFTAATTTQYTNRRPPRKSDVRIIQNYLVVWLDANIDENDHDYQNSIAMLREVSNTVNTFTDVDECISSINDITDSEDAFMISSGCTWTNNSAHDTGTAASQYHLHLLWK